MSGSTILGVFVAPAFMTLSEDLGPTPDNPVSIALNAPPYEGAIPYQPFYSGILPAETDDRGNEILPKRLAAGVCLVLVDAPSGAVINEIDALEDVRRIWQASPTAAPMTSAQKNAVETFLRDRGCDVDFSDTNSMQEMAERVCLRIVPNFASVGFVPGRFPPPP
jgi:hypothetical protein